MPRILMKRSFSRAIDVAHIHGRKLYLTVNTLLKNKELNEHLVSYLEPYYNAGLDAVIVQDMGVFFPSEEGISQASSSCQYTDDGDRPGRYEVSGRAGSNPGGCSKRAVPSGAFTHA